MAGTRTFERAQIPVVAGDFIGWLFTVAAHSWILSEFGTPTTEAEERISHARITQLRREWLKARLR